MEMAHHHLHLTESCLSSPVGSTGDDGGTRKIISPVGFVPGIQGRAFRLSVSGRYIPDETRGSANGAGSRVSFHCCSPVFIYSYYERYERSPTPYL
jgi:hypothetical protein